MPNNNYILTSSGSFLSEEELYHHGIKGMKWGVRKKQTTGAAKQTLRKTKKNRINGTAKRSLRKTNSNNFASQIQKERKRQKRYLASKYAISVGRVVANKYLQNHDVTINGNPARISSGAEALAKLGLNYAYAKRTLK